MQSLNDEGAGYIENIIGAIDQSSRTIRNPTLASLHLQPFSSTLDDWKVQLNRQLEHSKNRFTVLLLGEYNAGKSTLLNALLELPLDHSLPVSDVPTTALPIRLTYRNPGDPEARWVMQDKVNGQRVYVDKTWAEAVSQCQESTRDKQLNDLIEIHLFLDNQLLSLFDLMDMPGTGTAYYKAHTTLTRDYIANAEMVLWIIGQIEPSGEGSKDFDIAYQAGVPVRVIFNAWGSLDGRLNLATDDQYGLEESVHNYFPDAFIEHPGFRVFSYKSLEAERRNQQVEGSYGITALHDYLLQNCLEEFLDLRLQRQKNVLRQVGNLCHQALQQINEARIDWQNALEQQGDLGREISEDQDRIHQLGYDLRPSIETLAVIRANIILEYYKKTTLRFIDERICSDNQELKEAANSEDAKAAIDIYLRDTLNNRYLELNQPNNWLEQNLINFYEDSMVKVEEEWRRFLRAHNLKYDQSLDKDLVTLPFNQFQDMASKAIEKVNSQAGPIMYVISLFRKDPFEKSRQSAKHALLDKIEIQQVTLKDVLRKMIYDGPHKKLKKQFMDQMEQRSGKINEQIQALYAGLVALDELSEVMSGYIQNAEE